MTCVFTTGLILQLAVPVLELSSLCVENTSISPFQFCGIVIPKLVIDIYLTTPSPTPTLLLSSVLQFSHIDLSLLVCTHGVTFL